jgi:hypothetical protein
MTMETTKAPERPIEVEVLLMREDFVEFGLQHPKRGPKKPISWTWIVLESLVFLAFVAWLANAEDPLPYKMQFGALGFGFLVALYLVMVPIPFWLTRAELRRNFARSGVEGRTLRFVFADGGFTYSNGEKTVEKRWEDVERAKETAGSLGIYVGKSSIYLIPKRCFKDDDFRTLRTMMYGRVSERKLEFL